MYQSQQLGARVTIALVIAIALGVAWAAILLWSGFFIVQFFSHTSTFEQIEVLHDGTPVVQSQEVRDYSYLDATYRTMDGKMIEVDPENVFLATRITAPVKPPGLYTPDLGWYRRIAGLSDNQRPGVDWFVIRDNAVQGKVFFSGFDHDSKANVGFIGKNGFSRITPPHDEWFEIGREALDWGEQSLATRSQILPAQKSYDRYEVVSESRLPSWLVYVIDSDRLLEVDLRGRTVRKVLEDANILHVAIANVPPPRPADEASANNEKSKQNDFTPQKGIKWQSRVAVRTSDRLIVFDPRGTERFEFKLNDSLRDTWFTAYFLRREELLTVSKKSNTAPGTTEIGWMRPDGTFSKQQTVTLAEQSEPSPHLVAWIAAPVAPVPAGWFAVTGIFVPLGIVQNNQVAGYVQGLAFVLKFATLPMLVVIALSAILAWQTVKLQRKYHRPATRVWATFVFLLGLPGFLAYLVEQRRPKMEACPQCNDVVPRDRSACASCNAEFLAPPRLDTEIFA